MKYSTYIKGKLMSIIKQMETRHWLYDIKTASDIQKAVKDLLGGTIQSMLETELDEQVEDREENDPEYHGSRNGYKPKLQRSFQPDAAVEHG